MNAMKLGLLIIVIVAVSGLTLYLLYSNPTGPADVTVREVISDPSRYNGREVRLEGFLQKNWFLRGLSYNLTDADAGITISGNMDLDAYVGLKILVTGRLQYRPEILDAPKLLIEANAVQVKEGTPHFFLQYERSGGIAGLQEVFIIDNNSTASFLSRGESLWQRSLSQSKLQTAAQIILENGFLSLQDQQYAAREGVADYFTYRLKVILASDSKLESKDIVWVDEWASKEALPSNLTKVQNDLKALITDILNQPPEYTTTVTSTSTTSTTISVTTSTSTVTSLLLLLLLPS